MEWFSAWLVAVASLVASDDVRYGAVLAQLDDIRAEAYATEDPGLLDRVYVSGSAARDADAALIRDYQQRGAHVVGADLIVLSCHVKDASADRVSLDVVDRLAAAHVVWADGSARTLPRDLPTQRVVMLVRTADGWRIA